MSDWMESFREWEKVQLAKLAVMGSRWITDPQEAVKQVPQDLGAAGRNIAAMTGGALGDVASMVPGSEQSVGGQAPTSDDLVSKFGDREHFSYLPSMVAAPGPGEFKAAAKAMLGIGKDFSGVALAQTLFVGPPQKPKASVIDLTKRKQEIKREHDRIINEIRMRATEDIQGMITDSRIARVDPDSIHKIGDRFVTEGSSTYPEGVRLEIKKYNRVNDDGTVFYDVEQTFPDGHKGMVTLKNENLSYAKKFGDLRKIIDIVDKY